MKVNALNRDTFDSAIVLGTEALKLLGNSEEDANRAGQIFREHDIESVNQLADLWGDDASYGVAVRQRMEDLQQVLAKDTQARSRLNTCDETVKKGGVR